MTAHTSQATKPLNSTPALCRTAKFFPTTARLPLSKIVAIAMVHIRFGFWMNWTGAQKGEGFEYHLLLITASAFLIIRGAGAASVDRLFSSPAESRIKTQAHSQAA
jgi:hypothetical protein